MADTDEAAPAGAEAAPDETDATPTPRSPRPERGPLLLAWGVAGLWFVVAVTMTIVAVNLKGSRDSDAADRRSVQSVATRLGEALLSWDFEAPEDTRDRVLALGTGRFRDEYDKAFPDLKASLEAVKFQAVAAIDTVWVSDVEEGSASAMLVAHRSISTTSGQRTEKDIYLQLDLVKSEGEWKVDGVTNPRFALGGGADTTTTTSTP